MNSGRPLIPRLSSGVTSQSQNHGPSSTRHTASSRRQIRSRDGCLTCKYVQENSSTFVSNPYTGGEKSNVTSRDLDVHIVKDSIWSASGVPSSVQEPKEGKPQPLNHFHKLWSKACHQRIHHREHPCSNRAMQWTKYSIMQVSCGIMGTFGNKLHLKCTRIRGLRHPCW